MCNSFFKSVNYPQTCGQICAQFLFIHAPLCYTADRTISRTEEPSMKTLGIDIGTTTISAAVLEDRQFLASETRANGAFIPSALTCAREQDVEKITQTALSVIETLFERYPDIHSIGVTGKCTAFCMWTRTVMPSVRCTPGRTHAAACRTAKPKAGFSISRARRMPCRSRFRSGNARVQPCRRTCAARRRHLLHHR